MRGLLAQIGRALTRPRGKAVTPRQRRRERGIALLIVIGSLAILTAVAVEFRYQTAVDLQLAANARDELRAEYLARSAISLSRLILRFQKQLDGQAVSIPPQLMQLLSGAAGANAAGAAGALPPGLGGGSVNIQLWKLVPLNSSLFEILAGATQASRKPLGETPMHSFGDFSGSFSAEIQDEESKVNLNRLNLGAMRGTAPMLQALTMFGDQRFEFLYEKGDANNVKMTPQEILIALHDWIDDRDSQATLNITGQGDPFPDGFGDENRNYTSKYAHRYRSKNAPFDSLDELYQVDGVSDLFMSAFRERVTVYPDKNKPLNINTDDQLQRYLNIVSIANNPNDPKLNPAGVTIQLIMQQISLLKMFSFFGMSAQQFVGVVEGAGIQIRPDVKNAVSNNAWIGDKSDTFTIKATGKAGDVERTITAVVRNNDVLGKLLYYRAE